MFGGFWGRLAAVWSTLLNAAFGERNPVPGLVGALINFSFARRSAFEIHLPRNEAFAHIQLIAIAGAETSNPRRSVPAALRMTSAGVFSLYILVIFIIGLIVPADLPGLSDPALTALESPFVLAAKNAGIVSYRTLERRNTNIMLSPGLCRIVHQRDHPYQRFLCGESSTGA